MHRKKPEYDFYIRSDNMKSTIFFFIFSNVVGAYILQFRKKIYIAAFTSVLQLPRSWACNIQLGFIRYFLT